jgi:hypothetical protein
MPQADYAKQRCSWNREEWVLSFQEYSFLGIVQIT